MCLIIPTRVCLILNGQLGQDAAETGKVAFVEIIVKVIQHALAILNIEVVLHFVVDQIGWKGRLDKVVHVIVNRF